MAQDPGRVFPGKRMTGHMGDETVTTQNLDVVRIDEARQLLLIKGAIPGSQRWLRVRAACHQGQSFQRSELMQLELLNEQGQAASKFDAPETVFGRAYNEDLIHQIGDCLPCQRPSRHARSERPPTGSVTRPKSLSSKRVRATPVLGMTSSPLWRGGGRMFPNLPEENFTQKINKKMYRAGMAAILSQLAREGRLAVVDSLKVDSPQDQGAGRQVQGHEPAVVGDGDR